MSDSAAYGQKCVTCGKTQEDGRHGDVTGGHDFIASAATTPEDDPLIVALLEAHAILAGMQSKGITAFPGPRENAMAKIELATRIRKAEL